MDNHVEVETDLFGEVCIDEDRILNFPEGLWGFKDCQKFFLVDMDPDLPPMKYLQAVSIPELAFVVADPRVVFSGYQPHLPADELDKIDVNDPSEALLLVIVVIPDHDISLMTANLKAPLVINPEKRLGRQIITPSDKYDVKHRLFPDSTQPGPIFKKALPGD